eukprot:4025776-Heterocapsa_arctica.AAC.1
MEQLEGGEVFDHLLEKGSLSESETALVVEQLLRAVEHLHGKGLVHRDIKLENIMYESRDRDKVKLIDFGLCCSCEQGMAPMTRICSTPSYVSYVMYKGRFTK